MTLISDDNIIKANTVEKPESLTCFVNKLLVS